MPVEALKGPAVREILKRYVDIEYTIGDIAYVYV